MLKYVLLLLTLVTTTLYSAPGHHSRVDTHAPIAVMGDHTHPEGESMFSYRFMRMSMAGMLKGSETYSNASVLTHYMNRPDSMTMEMHMLGGMYGLNDQITLMAMVPYLRQSMSSVTHQDQSFSVQSQGLSDPSLSVLYALIKEDQHRSHVGLGISLPLGKIDVQDDMPMGKGTLGYGMQLGSGTPDLLPSFTYTAFLHDLSWGVQVCGRYRLGQNNKGYTLGHALSASVWGAKVLTSSWSTSLRLALSAQTKITHSHQDLDTDTSSQDMSSMSHSSSKTMSPMMEAANSGHLIADIGIGLNYLHHSGFFKGYRVALEYLLPVYQRIAGIQMRREGTLTLGVQKAF